MAMTYHWTCAEKTAVYRTDDCGNVAWISIEPPGKGADEFSSWLAKGNVPEIAPAPAELPAPTIEQKIAALGLTISELRELLVDPRWLEEGNEPLPADVEATPPQQDTTES